MWTLGTRLELQQNPNLHKSLTFYKHPKVQKSLPSQPEKRVKQQQKKIEQIFGFPRGPRPGGGGGEKQESSVRPPGIVNQARR